jgi:hypothetical protein
MLDRIQKTQMSTQDKDTTPADVEAPATGPDTDAGHAAEGKKGGRNSSGGKAPRKALTKRAAGEPRVVKKRGPPRPHRRLAQEVLTARVTKLEKRIIKARGLLEESERHMEAYSNECKYRAAETKEAEGAV